MAKPYKDKRGNWYQPFFDSNKRPKQVRVPLNVSSKADAEVVASKIKLDVALGKLDPWNLPRSSSGLTLSESVEAYISDKGTELRDKTKVEYRSVIKLFIRSIGFDLKIHQVSRQQIQEFVLDKDVSPATRRHRFGHLRPIFNWAEKEGILEDNPFGQLKAPKLEKKQPRYLTPDEFRSFEEFLLKLPQRNDVPTRLQGERSSWLRPLVCLAVYSGMRRGELIALDWEDIQLEQKRALVRNKEGFKTKSGHERAVPLVPQALELLQEWAGGAIETRSGAVFQGINGNRLSGEFASKKFKEAAMIHGLPNEFRFHDLRKTCASFLATSGVPDRIATQIMGWSDSRMMEIYAGLRPDSIQDAMEQAFADI